MTSFVIVVPARMGSVRFPGKPLADLCGKPMVQWVVEAAIPSGASDRVVVATPDAEIVEACRAFGAECVTTSPECPTGTDRVAEVARAIVADAYVNVQGDEPLMPAADIAECARALEQDPDCACASLWCPLAPEESDDPTCVKVVLDAKDRALYFSRSRIPYVRGEETTPAKKHVGLYAYRREALLAFQSLRAGPLERAESLEQLRFLENGYAIAMSRGQGTPVAVDTPDQAEQVRRLLAARTEPARPI